MIKVPIAERTQPKHYSCKDLALALADQQGLSHDFFMGKIREGYAKGWLKFYLPDGTPLDYKEPATEQSIPYEYYLGLSGEYTKSSDINHWLECWGADYRLSDTASEKTGHGTKQASQRDAILGAIRGLGHDPKALPVRQVGKPGIKSEVKKCLDGHPPFEARNSFDGAWKDLRSLGAIAEA